jgi:hypothetical protein
MPDSLDLAIKNTDENSLIKITDFLNLDTATYVSKRGRKETIILDAMSREVGSNEALFTSLAEKIKKQYDKPVLIGASDATHYGFVNSNYCWYSMDSIDGNAKTWIVKTANGNWGRPVQVDHTDEQKDVIGRVYAATPFKYEKPNENNLDVPDGHIELIWVIPDEEAIEKIVDGRMRTVSVGAGAKPNSVQCSICGMSPRSMECTHMRGMEYDMADSGEKKLAYWVFHKKDYQEVSFVSRPADTRAVQKRFSIINIDGKEQDDKDAIRKVNERSSFSIGIGHANKDKVITGIVDLFGDSLTNDLLISRDSIVDESVKIASSQSSETGHKSSANTQIPAQNTGTKIDDSEEDQANVQTAAVGLILDMLENNSIDLKAAVDAAFSIGNFYIPLKINKIKDEVVKHLGRYLNHINSPISPDNKPNLQDYVFAGPMRTLPIIDKHHVVAANALMDAYLGCDKTRVATTIQRKMSALIGDKMQNNLNKEDKTVSNFTFDSEEALLASAPVQKALDKVKTENEQALDKIKKEFSSQENKFKTIAVDAIISASLKLGKPLTVQLSSLSGDEAVKERKNISDRLQNRSFDSLVDSVNDYNEELEHKKIADSSAASVASDPNQGKLEAALNQSKDTVPAPAAAPAATVADTASSTDTATTDTTTAAPDASTAAPANASATASAPKPAETINQADATAAAAATGTEVPAADDKIKSILKAITKASKK